jgi:hypothetical protein
MPPLPNEEQEQQFGRTVTGGRDESLLLPLQIILTVMQLADNNVGRYYRKWGLDSALNGRTLLTTVPSTKSTGPSGTPKLWGMAS